MTDIPITLADVTPQWLNGQLDDAGHGLPPIVGITVDPMDGFVGALGEVGVVGVHWDGDDEALPSSFVAKCPLDDDMARLYNQVMQYYVREAGFYRDLAHQVELRVPRAWVNRFDPDTGSGFLMLEHITGATSGDVLAGCSVEQMQRLVIDLAQMHGSFWMDGDLRELDWLMDWGAESFHMGIPFVQDAWATLMTQEPDRIPSDVAAAIQRTWIDDTVTWLEHMTERPWTLTHIDYELDNILFTEDGPVVVDWQSPMRSFPGMDLGWLLAASHNEETLEAEPELLDLYRAELASAGGPSWSAEELEEDLALGMLQFTGGAPIPYLQDTTGFGEGAQRMHARFDKFLQGCIDACLRWHLPDHLEAQ